MRRNRTDKLSGDLKRIRQGRQRRIEQREIQRSHGEKSSIEEQWENYMDSWEFNSQELHAFGRSAGRDLGRTAKSVGRELLEQACELTADFLLTLVTLGLAPPASELRRTKRRNRR